MHYTALPTQPSCERDSALYESITSWLQSVPHRRKTSRCKRQPLTRRDTNVLPTPMECPLSVGRKRKVREVVPWDEEPFDPTPRAPRTREECDPNSPTSVSVRTGTPSGASTTSRRSNSPVKRLADIHSIHLKQFSDVDSMLPTRMRELVTSMRRIGRGLGVISKSRMVSVYWQDGTTSQTAYNY
jgi:hypothetical protein